MKKKLLVLTMALSVILTACAGKEVATSSGVVAGEETASVAQEIESETPVEETKEEAVADFEPGILSETGYTSEWLGMTYTAPENAMMFTKEQMDEAMGLGGELLSEEFDQEDLAEALETTSYEMMTMESSGLVNIILGVEKLPLSFITVDQYLAAFKDQYTTIEAMNTEIISEEGTIQVAGQEFRELIIQDNSDGSSMLQKYLLRKQGSYMVMCIVTYTEDTEAIADEMLNAFQAN